MIDLNKKFRQKLKIIKNNISTILVISLYVIIFILIAVPYKELAIILIVVIIFLLLCDVRDNGGKEI